LTLNHYPHHIGDYIKDTAHLDPTEDGIYRRMLDLYYTSEKPLDAHQERLCRRIRVDFERYKGVVDALLMEFFQRTDEGWRHARCDREILKYQSRSDANRENGKAGGRPRNPRKSEKKPNGLRKITHTGSGSGSGLSIDAPNFDKFWRVYPKRVSKGAAEKSFAKLNPDEQLLAVIIAAVERAKGTEDWLKDGGQFIPHPATYLNQKRWLDEGPTLAVARKGPVW